MKMTKVVTSLFVAVLLSGCSPASREHAEVLATADRLAGQINNDFARIRGEAEQVARFVMDLYERRAEILPGIDTSRYAMAPNGAFYKPENDGGAALWISGAVPITEAVKEVAYFTEPLDAELKRVCEYPEVVQAYYNDQHSLNRIYPWFDALAQYPPKMNIPEFNFYYLADAAHNPGKKGVWVNEPYVDPAGRGWMVSAIAPVYVGDALQGVPGLDVTIDTITARYLKDSEAVCAIVTDTGALVAAAEKAIEWMEMPPVKDHKYIETIKQDTFKPDDYDLLKARARSVRAMAEAMLKQGQREYLLKAGEQTLRVVASPITELNWYLLLFAPEG